MDELKERRLEKSYEVVGEVGSIIANTVGPAVADLLDDTRGDELRRLFENSGMDFEAVIWDVVYQVVGNLTIALFHQIDREQDALPQILAIWEAHCSMYELVSINPWITPTCPCPDRKCPRSSSNRADISKWMVLSISQLDALMKEGKPYRDALALVVRVYATLASKVEGT